MKHKHHIIPKHMGGSDDPSNLIELSVEEHAEAHRILYEKHNLQQDFIAWKCLSGQISNQEAIILAVKNANTGRKHTTEQKLSRSKKMIGKGNHFFGKTHKAESKKKISESKIGKPSWNLNKKSSWTTERNINNNPSKNPEVRSKMSAAKKGKSWSIDPKSGKRVWT